MTLYWGKFTRGNQTYYVVTSKEGISYIGLNEDDLDEINRRVKKKYPNAKLIEDNEKTKIYVKQLKEYMDGKRKEFEMDIVLHGTPFQEAVWKVLQSIPYGETRSYSDIAKLIGKEKAVRAVGSAIGANPLPIIVPCHRVIGKSGNLSGYRGGIEMKKEFLAIEEITFH